MTSATRAPTTKRWWLSSPATVFGGACALFALLSARFADFTVDDAFISFRYAHNLIAGQGLVFNPGERVEGYTNFLFVLYTSAALRLGIDPELAARVLSIAACGGLIAACVRFGPRSSQFPLVAWIAPLVVAVSPAMAVWAMAGMEAPLFAALTTWGTCLAVRQAEPPRLTPISAVLFGVAAWTRPEGAGVAAAVAVLVALLHGRRIAARAWLLWCGVFLLLFVPYFVWRWQYYGYPFPNTFYAKVGGTSAQAQRGLLYVHDFFVVTGYWLLPVAIAALWSRARRWIAVLAGTGLWWVTAVVLLGGDNQPMYRFCLPIIPLLALLVAWGTTACLERLQGLLALPARRAVGGFAAVTMLAVIGYTVRPAFHGHQYDFVRAHTREVDAWRQIGRWFRAHAAPNDLLALIPAGAIPYYAELPALDMLGLNDVHIAHREMPAMGSGPVGHEKSDVDYVVQRAPTYILIGVYGLSQRALPAQRLIAPDYAAERLLLRHPEFRAHYRAEVGQTAGGYFAYFVRAG